MSISGKAVILMLGILTGTYYHNLDAKGRMNFPTKLRELLGDTFIVTRGTDKRCLTVYSNEGWEKLSRKVSELPESKGAAIKRWLFSGAAELVPDKQGRVLIPAELRKFASLEKEAVVIGADDKAEIWSKNNWDEFNSEFDISEMVSLMDSLGF